MMRKNRRVSGGYRRSILFKGFGGIRFDPGTAPSAMEAHEVVVDKSMTSSELLCSAPKSERDE
ncbi:hypothetical protein SPHINGO361_140227 [Sphingomonas sp. EC-HK361]|mgnify:FL=1|nr:hypothetical protein SPHINGO361_140227 [Sphingomonas sp. EC-HK361]